MQASNTEEIKDFAESITDFFLVFDGLFLFNEKAEELLEKTKTSLKEIESLQQLLKARKNLQKATEREQTKKVNNAEILALFGC